jgi:hypothetical protein
MLFLKWVSSRDPLNSLTSNKLKFEWHSSHQQAFDELSKSLELKCSVPLFYPDFNKPFHLNTDASDDQLGGSHHAG